MWKKIEPNLPLIGVCLSVAGLAYAWRQPLMDWLKSPSQFQRSTAVNGSAPIPPLVVTPGGNKAFDYSGVLNSISSLAGNFLSQDPGAYVDPTSGVVTGSGGASSDGSGGTDQATQDYYMNVAGGANPYA